MTDIHRGVTTGHEVGEGGVLQQQVGSWWRRRRAISKSMPAYQVKPTADGECLVQRGIWGLFWLSVSGPMPADEARDLADDLTKRAEAIRLGLRMPQ